VRRAADTAAARLAASRPPNASTSRPPPCPAVVAPPPRPHPAPRASAMPPGPVTPAPTPPVRPVSLPPDRRRYGTSRALAGPSPRSRQGHRTRRRFRHVPHRRPGCRSLLLAGPSGPLPPYPRLPGRSRRLRPHGRSHRLCHPRRSRLRLRLRHTGRSPRPWSSGLLHGQNPRPWSSPLPQGRRHRPRPSCPGCSSTRHPSCRPAPRPLPYGTSRPSRHHLPYGRNRPSPRRLHPPGTGRRRPTGSEPADGRAEKAAAGSRPTDAADVRPRSRPSRAGASGGSTSAGWPCCWRFR